MADYADITVNAVFPVTVYEYSSFVRGWTSGFQVDKDYEINGQMTNEMVLYEFKPDPNDKVEGEVKKVEFGVKFASYDNIPVKAYLFKEKGKYSDMYNGEGKLGEVTVTSNGWYVAQLTFSGLNIENYENLYIGFVDNSNSGEWCSCTYQFNYAKITTRTPSLKITPETGSVVLSENHFETYFTIQNDLGIDELAVQFKIGQSPVTGSKQTLDVEDIEGTKRTTTYSTDTIYAWMKTSPNTKYSVSFTVEATDKYGRTALATIKIALPALTINADNRSLTFNDIIEVYQTDAITGEDNPVIITLTSNQNSEYIQNGSTCEYDWFSQTGQGSKDEITISAKATDSFRRNSDSLTIKASKPPIGATVSQNEYQINTLIHIKKTDNTRDINVTIKSGNVEFVKDLLFPWRDSDADILVSAAWFDKVAGNNGKITGVEIDFTDEIYRSQKISPITISGIVDGENKIVPQLSSFWLTNVGDNRLNNTQYANSFVSGYSKVNTEVYVSSLPGSDISSVKFSGGGFNDVQMEKKTGSAYHRGTTPDAVTVSGTEVTFTVSATDEWNRTNTKTRKQTFVKLPTWQIKQLTPSTVITGNKVTCVIAGRVDKTNGTTESTYTLKRGDALLTKEPVKFTDTTFAIDVAASWVPDSASEAKITLIVTDYLGRTASKDFIAKLPVFAVNVPEDPVIIDSDVTFTFEGTSGQSVNLSLMVGNAAKYNETIEGDSVTVHCPKDWITSGSYVDVTVNATCGNRTDNTKKFTLKYPDLVLETDKTESTPYGYVIYTFSNREGQSVYLEYYYGSRRLLREGPFSEDFGGPLADFFDLVPITTAQVMYIDICATDAIGRMSNKVKLKLTPSFMMDPRLLNYAFTAIQPETVDPALANCVFLGITRIRLSGAYELPTLAKMSKVRISLKKLYSLGYATINSETDTFVFEQTDNEGNPVPITEDVPRLIEFTDERGLESTYETAEIPSINYRAPRINVSYHRCDSNGVKSDTGDHCQITVEYSVDHISGRTFDGTWLYNANRATITISTTGYEETVSIPTYESGEAVYESTFTDIFPADIEKSFEISVNVKDRVMEYTNTYLLSTAGVIMDFRRGGKGVGIGKVAEGDKRVEIHPEWKLMASVQISGRAQLQDLSTLLEEILTRLSNGGL